MARAVGDDEVCEAVKVILDERLHWPRVWRDCRRALRKRSLRELHWPRPRAEPQRRGPRVVWKP